MTNTNTQIAIELPTIKDNKLPDGVKPVPEVPLEKVPLISSRVSIVRGC